MDPVAAPANWVDPAYAISFIRDSHLRQHTKENKLSFSFEVPSESNSTVGESIKVVITVRVLRSTVTRRQHDPSCVRLELDLYPTSLACISLGYLPRINEIPFVAKGISYPWKALL